MSDSSRDSVLKSIIQTSKLWSIAGTRSWDTFEELIALCNPPEPWEIMKALIHVRKEWTRIEAYIDNDDLDYDAVMDLHI